MASTKLNICNYLDLSEGTINKIVDYVEKYILSTPTYDIEDISCEHIGKAILYVDFGIFMDGVTIKGVTVQDELHHIDMERDSAVIKWILETNLPALNREKKALQDQEKQIINEHQYC